MTATDPQMIANVVEEVLRRMDGSPPKAERLQPLSAPAHHQPPAPHNTTGLFQNVDAAVAAATDAQRQLVNAGVNVRDSICKLIKRIAVDNAPQWGRFELDETKVGRLDHKIAKLELLQSVPGVDMLRTAAHSGDDGVGLDEGAPWGVIGVITPVTHSIPTMAANAINMIAAGNTMVVNAHPSGAKSVALATKTFNEAIQREFNVGPLICAIDPPTLESANAIFEHRDIPLLVATGGPAVARAALKQAKRAIVAGPGNPPVVVDETADLDNAARSIIQGAAFDNNLLCIGEKEVFVVASVFDKMMQAMERAGAMRLNAQQVQQLTDKAFDWKTDHYAVNKDFVGKDPHVIGQLAGFNVPQNIELIFGETDESNPFVPEEQMMPFVPFVKVRDFNEALDLALKHEHGFGHTAIIHSNNLANITTMGRATNTTIFVANGPCTAGLGIGGEGYPSYSIATPTGEGITNPMTFTRFRRASIAGALRIV
ncbi:aldehyde dehydrogenase [Phycisphaerales bacterium AB-hyl4]|uniref:Aldehyde dehydrogenase n=1 Tax=Natronomicrosphaera hydrolytica TaxID=3242702 RepID=A0ABV4UAY2_9BACT